MISWLQHDFFSPAIRKKQGSSLPSHDYVSRLSRGLSITLRRYCFAQCLTLLQTEIIAGLGQTASTQQDRPQGRMASMEQGDRERARERQRRTEIETESEREMGKKETPAKKAGVWHA